MRDNCLTTTGKHEARRRCDKVGRRVRYSACSHRFELEFLGLPVTATSVRNRSKCAVVLDIGPREAYHELRFIGSGRSDARSLDIVQETVIADTIRQECWC